MRRRLYTYRPIALRFKRWSRKGYAAFVSVQRAVTIGHLSAGVAERSLTKSNTLQASVLTPFKDDKERDESATIPSDSSGGSPWSLLLLETILCPVQTAMRTADACAHIPNDIISETAEDLGAKPKVFRSFRLPKHYII